MHAFDYSDSEARSSTVNMPMAIVERVSAEELKANWTPSDKMAVEKAILAAMDAEETVRAMKEALPEATDPEAARKELKKAEFVLLRANQLVEVAKSKADVAAESIALSNRVKSRTTAIASKAGSFSIAVSNYWFRSKVHGVDVLLETLTVSVALLYATSLLAFCLMNWSGSGADDV